MPFDQQKTTKTSYGIKRPGTSPFVIIAPHGAGDDLKSGIIVKKIAKQLDAFFIINYNYKKPSNSDKKGRIEDFNKLCWSEKHNKYLWRWSKKKKAMREFFKDIADFCDQAKKRHRHRKAIAIYIHGLKDRGEKIGIDIGAGLKSIKDRNRFLFSFKHSSDNSGMATVKIGQLKKLKHTIEQRLKKDHKLLVNVGHIHTGWSKSSAIQFHKHEGRNDYAIQLEINELLRNNQKNTNYTADLIASALKKVFI